MENEIEKLIRCLNTGLSPMIVVTGTIDEMMHLREALIEKLTEDSVRLAEIELTNDEFTIAPEDSGEEGELLIVWGLESLSPKDSRTYALRSFLDMEKFQGLRAIIFCEKSRYGPHFNRYSAPFYHFCLRLAIGVTGHG